jgi:ketosteroid isomerase-like protein
MQTDLIRLMQQWLDILARGAVDEWSGKVSPEVVLRFPFAPPGVNPELRGIEQARDTIGAFWKTWQNFNWQDVVIRHTEDPSLLVTTAKSQAKTVFGHVYANSYVIFTRFKDGEVIEHTEYFNPLPIVEMMQQAGAG